MISLLEGYIQDSLPYGEDLFTHPSLTNKVDQNGRIIPYHGNTTVFLLSEDTKTQVAQLQDRLYRAAQAVVGEENIFPNTRSMGGEDFAFFAQRKPAAMFRLGVRSEEKGCVYSTHQDRFDLDEDALQVGSDIFVTFVRQTAGGLG